MILLELQVKSTHRFADATLLLLYIAICAVILLRVNVESTGYLSPDSEAYISLVKNLKEGNGFYLYNASTTERTFFSIWPVGYPVLIYFVSAVTSLSAFWASKVLNLLLLGLGFLLLRQINREYSYILASVYCSYTLLEVYSFTWSEAPFLLGLLYLCYLTGRILQQEVAGRDLILFFLTCLFLFLMRYIGAFSFGVPALLACFCYYKREHKAVSCLLLVLFLLGASAGLYLFINYRLSGYPTGFDRLEAETESAGAFIYMMAEGLLNELLLIRKFRVGNQPDYLFYFTTLLQLAVTVFVVIKVRSYRHLPDVQKNYSFTPICFLVALLYLAAIVFLRSVSHFDNLDYRLLAPCSFLFWIGIVNLLVSLPDTFRSAVQVKNVVFIFFVVSLLLNLPKQYIVDRIISLVP